MDPVHGGFYGALSNDLKIFNDVPRSAVLCARLLWTFSAAYRRFADPVYRATADYARDYLMRVFWDTEYGGVYWSVNAEGQPVEDRKHTYAQSFAIYGLVEYYRATGDGASLDLACRLYALIDAHTIDPIYGGNREGCSRVWGEPADPRLSEKDLWATKSMNTLLHVMEAYTNLLRVWPDEGLQKRVRELIEIFLLRVIDPETRHFRLFFDDDWRSLAPVFSYGHDIEGSWLLVEAAEVLGDVTLLAKVKLAALQLAEAVRVEGLEPDGALIYEGNCDDPHRYDKHWWPQAEAMVGFFNAWQISGDPLFAEAAAGAWEFITGHMVDRVNGDWFKVLNREGVPYPDYFKAGPWECPYHHARACLEILERVDSRK